MKKFQFIMIYLLLICMFCGCEDGDKQVDDSIKLKDTTDSVTSDEKLDDVLETQVDHYRQHQELTNTIVQFDSNEMMRISLPDVGLENVFVECVQEGILHNNKYGKVYLLADDRYGGRRMPADHYLLIVVNDEIIVKDTSKWENHACYSGVIELSDFDGDGDKEILLQETIGITGGAGSYLSRVFDFKDDEIREIFSSRLVENEFMMMDTGFSINILTNKQFEIQNSKTGYCEVFQHEGKDEDYYTKWWYDENGTPRNLSIEADSFMEFTSTDIEDDGVFEIKCTQYVSLVGHSDGIGWAKSVIKYNNDSMCFEIIESYFVPISHVQLQ